jgi:hypothetical protein
MTLAAVMGDPIPPACFRGVQARLVRSRPTAGYPISADRTEGGARE